MLKSLLSVSCLFVLIAGCSGSGSGGNNNLDGGVGEFSTDDLGYNPYTRWPQQQDMAYSFDYSYNGARCLAQKTFKNKAQFCLGLQDQTLNEGCALPARRSTYNEECGNDFQELNFSSGYWRYGYDSRLRKTCETGRVAKFKTTKHYCEFLKDENLHANCHWDGRREEFEKHACRGEFSLEPVAQKPEPQPPQPPQQPEEQDERETEQPEPPADPLDSVAVVRKLRENGFKVSIDWEAIRQMERYPMPGQSSSEEKLKTTFAELDANVDAILARKNMFNEIEVTIYTNYRTFGNRKSLHIDYETNPGELNRYFPLFDKIVKYGDQLKIDFDFIHSGSRNDAKPYLPLTEVISAVESNWNDLLVAKGLIKEVNVDSFTNYFSPSRIVTLNRKSISQDFKTMLQQFKPIAPVFNWADKNNIELEANFDIKKDLPAIQAAFAALEKSLPDLDKLAQVKGLKEINVFFVDGEVSYWSTIKSMSIPLLPSSRNRVAQSLQSLGKLAQMQMEFKKEIGVSYEKLTPEFDTVVKLMSSVWSQVMAKSAKIKKISVSGHGNTKYWDVLQELSIGGKSTQKETEAVITAIR